MQSLYPLRKWQSELPPTPHPGHEVDVLALAGDAGVRLDIEARLRARSHCRLVLTLIHFIPDSLTETVPLFLNRRCDRALGPPQGPCRVCSGPPSAPPSHMSRGVSHTHPCVSTISVRNPPSTQTVCSIEQFCLDAGF